MTDGGRRGAPPSAHRYVFKEKTLEDGKKVLCVDTNKHVLWVKKDAATVAAIKEYADAHLVRNKDSTLTFHVGGKPPYNPLLAICGRLPRPPGDG